MKIKKIKFWIGPFVIIIFFMTSHFQPFVNDYFKFISNFNSIGFKILEVNDRTNFTHRHHLLKINGFENVKNWISSGGAGVTVDDFNQDGFMDILLSDSGEGQPQTLFINDQHGKFINKTSELGLLDKNLQNGQTRIISFDSNNDGYPDLLFLSNCPKLYINDHGKHFIDKSKESGLPTICTGGYVFAANAFDYDKDGNLDLIFGAYMANDFLGNAGKTAGILPDNFNDSANGAPIYLFKGDGHGHFENKTNLLPKEIRQRGWFLDIGILDLFKNGNQDLWLATDFGLSEPLEFISSAIGWKDRSSLTKHQTKSRNSMSVSISDFDHQGNSKILVTNIFREKEKINGNLLWEYNKRKNIFSEFGKEAKINECGWPWASQFIDLNNDSWDDLVIVNGMYGGGNSNPSYWYNLSVLDSSGKSFMGDYKNWPSDEKFELDGNQKDCIFLNQGPTKSFVDISKYFDVFDKDKKNGRALAYLDMNNTGNLSLIVANQNDEAKIYDIIPKNDFKWVGIYLKTSNHNSFAIGSVISWGLSDGNHSFKEMRPISGYMSQNDPRFRLAFPVDKTLKYLKIKWLDGGQQEIDLKNIKMNSYNTINRELK